MISLGRLIDILGLTDEADVAQLERQRDAALAFIQTQTNRYFGPIETFTEYIRGTGTRSLYLRDIPQVGGVYTTTVLETDYPDDVGSAVTGSVQRIHGHEAELLRAGSGGVWTQGSDYAVTYSRGYAEDAGPKDIEQLVIDLLKNRLATADKEGLNSETIGGYSWSRPAVYAFEDGDLKAIPGALRTIEAWTRLVFA